MMLESVNAKKYYFSNSFGQKLPLNLRSVKIKKAKEFGVRHVSQLPEPKRVGVGSSYFDE